MTTKNKLYLSIIIFLLLSVFLLIFLILPLYRDIQGNSQELISKKKDLAFFENKIKNIEEFRKNYKEIKENLEKIKNLFINPKAPINFISFLEESSQVSQLQIEIFPSAVTKDIYSPWSYMAFGTDSVCAFPNFLRFLEKLESSPYLLETRTLNITKLTEKDLKLKKLEGFSLGDVQISLSIKVFAD